MHMTEETEFILQSPAMAKYMRQPFGGLLGDTVLLKVVAELVADPYTLYHNVDLAALTRTSPDSVANVLKRLVDLGFVKNTTPGAKHPAYMVDLSSKRLLAMTLLAYGVMDDRDDTRVMDDAIKHYCHEHLGFESSGADVEVVSDFEASGSKYTCTVRSTSKVPSPIMGVPA